MNLLFLALARSLGSLGHLRVWRALLLPAVLAMIVMAGLSFFLLDQIVAFLLDAPPVHWIAAWGALAFAHLLASLGGWLLLLSAAYLVAVVLTGILVMPRLLELLSVGDYADVERQGKDSMLASTANSLWAALLFVIGGALTLPLWLIPGAGLFLPLFWMAWLNRRTFAYDALSLHATPAEWRELRRRHAGALFGLGIVMAVLSHVPVLGLLAPSLAALGYIHFCLEALRRLRSAPTAIKFNRENT